MKNKKSNKYALLAMFGSIALLLILNELQDTIGKLFFSIFTGKNPIIIFDDSNINLLYLLGIVCLAISTTIIMSDKVRVRFFHETSWKLGLKMYLFLFAGLCCTLASFANLTVVTADSVYFIHNMYTNNIEVVKFEDISIVNIDAKGYLDVGGRSRTCQLRVNMSLFDKNKSYDLNISSPDQRDKIYRLNSLIDSSVKRYVGYSATCNYGEYKEELEENLGISIK